MDEGGLQEGDRAGLQDFGVLWVSGLLFFVVDKGGLQEGDKAAMRDFKVL